jgi:hypothetical protein
MPATKVWYKIFYDLGIGSLITLSFYLLVICLPEYQQRQRLKRSLGEQYRTFRYDYIATMLSVVEGGYSTDLAENLWNKMNSKDISARTSAQTKPDGMHFRINLIKYRWRNYS